MRALKASFLIAVLTALAGVPMARAAADPVSLILGYIVTPRADGTLPGVRVVFFPELGWGQGGKGPELRDKIIQSLKAL